MQKLLAKCWNDDAGAIIASEFLFIATILVVSLVVGLTSVRNAVNTELTELANSVLALNQGFTIAGQVGCGASVEGTAVINVPGAQFQFCPLNTPPSFPIAVGGCNACNVPCL
jgi:hypothetical protein